MLVDQGFETMEGASGDDWISGAQSMRAYMRGAEICGVIAAFIRSLGWSRALADQRRFRRAAAAAGAAGGAGRAVAHRRTGAQSLRRPALQAVVVTTDLPLALGPADRLRPAGHVLQQVPEVRARMPLQRDLVRRQGDVQRLRDVEAGRRALHALPRHQPARLGLRALHEDLPVQPRGPARAPRGSCGRRSICPWARRWIVRYDDRVGNGSINPAKTWWTDLEIVDGKVRPAEGREPQEPDPAQACQGP